MKSYATFEPTNDWSGFIGKIMEVIIKKVRRQLNE